MFLIPITYLPAAFILLLLVRLIQLGSSSKSNPFYLMFLGLVAFQLILIGSRFGYGVESIGRYQPLFASLIPPLAYLGFVNPAKRDWRVFLPILSLFLVATAMLLSRSLIDFLLGINALSYVGVLIRRGLKGTDGVQHR
ncbi:MAG: hypothetical protein GKR96_04785 [Gammaproteobacteria bacterium]|nr:hypothetical protein [Gammaproteobacteria bacterium]